MAVFIVFFFLLIIRLYRIFNVFNISHDIALIAVEMQGEALMLSLFSIDHLYDEA